MAGSSVKKMMFLSPLWFGIGQYQVLADRYELMLESQLICTTDGKSIPASVAHPRQHRTLCSQSVRPQLILVPTPADDSGYSVPDSLHNVVRFSLRIPILAYRFYSATHRVPYLLQCHGSSRPRLRYRPISSKALQ